METEQPALSLNWLFGTSTDVANNVVNLSDGYSDRICYVAAHTGVIFDKRTRKQLFLQGHANTLSCLAATEDRSTIITADVGNESLLVLWDSTTGNPLRSIPRPHAHGVLVMDVSPGGDWLATISAPNPDTGEQEIALWSIQALVAPSAPDAPPPRPAVLSTIPAGDTQRAVRFNMNNRAELISNGKRRVFFWASTPTSARFKYYSPPLRSKDFKQSVGDFVMSVFVPGSQQALTATSDGDLVVWDEQGITAQMGTRATDRRAAKLMRIHQQAVTFLGTIGDYIVSGGQDGFVRFYDPLLRIVAWFEDLTAGPITGVSFSLAMPAPSSNPDMAENLNRFLAPDFVVSTGEGRLLSIQAASFEEFDLARRRGTLLLEPMITDACDVSCHPTRPELAVLGRNGMLQQWDMIRHECVASRQFSKAAGTHVVYARDGSFMVVALESGYLHIINTTDLSDIHMARNTAHNIVRLATASTCRTIVLADSANQVLMYAYLPYKHIMRWEFVGKARAHHAPVMGLVFGETPAGYTRLFSMGTENRVVEYELSESTPSTGLVIHSHHDLVSDHTPTALSFAPPLQYFKHHSPRTLLLITDDGFKVKMFDPDAKAVVAVFLGPTFGGPLQQLIVFKAPGSDDAFLAYATAARIVGLSAWPMDGDPAHNVGLIAHPAAINAAAVSYNGRKLVTSGSDGTLALWDVSPTVLAGQVAASASRPQRWEQVLDNPSLLEDMMDYFIYAQIKAQGEDAMEPRDTSGLVPVSMVPDVMRALGFYPSESQVEHLMQNVAFIASSQDLDALTHIDFTTLLKLYINHRPLAQPSVADLVDAFRALGSSATHGRLARDVLLHALQHAGEAMSPDEVVSVLQALTGQVKVSDSMPPNVDAEHFATQVLGFEAPEPTPA